VQKKENLFTWIDPKDSEAYYQLGNVYELRADYKKAYANYIKAEELDPNNLANQAKLGWFYLFLIKDEAKAQEKIDFILAKDKNNIEGRLLKASMMLKNEDLAEALKIAEDIVSNEPGNVNAVIFLAKLYLNNKNIEKSKKVLESALRVKPDNQKLNKLLGLVLVDNKEYQRAEAIYRKLFDVDPDSRLSYKLLAAFYNTAGDKDKAVKILRESIDNDQADVDRYYDLIKYISVISGNEVAIDELKKFVKNNKNLEGLRLALAEYYYVNKKIPEAISVYEKSIKDFPEGKTGVTARVALASLYIAEKRLDEAKVLIEEAIALSPNDPKANMLKAKMAIFDKDFEKAIIALRIVVKEAPENIDAYFHLAKAHALTGSNEQAKSVLHSAYENNKNNPDSLLRLSKIYLQSDPVLAEKIIDDFNKLKSNNYEGLSIKASLLNQKKNVSEALKISEGLMNTYSNMPNGYIQAVPYYLTHGDESKAILVLEKGYVLAKDNRKILSILTSLQVAKKELGAVKDRLNVEIDKSPDDMSLKLMLSKVYLTENDSKSALLLLNSIIEKAPEFEDSYILLAKVYQHNKDIESMKSVLEKGIANIPSSKKITIRLAAIYEFEESYKKAVKVYEDLYKEHPDDLLVINNYVSLLSDHGNEKSDLAIAKSLINKLYNQKEGVFLDTVGWVKYKLGEYDEAIKDLSKVVEASPDINVFNYHLGMAYKMSGDKTQAKTYLEKSLADGKKFKGKELAKAALKDL